MYDGQTYEGETTAALKYDSHAELLAEWLTKGTVAEAKILAFTDADIALFSPKSTHREWLTELSNQDYGAFRGIRQAVRDMYHSGMTDKDIGKYLVLKKAEFPDIKYSPYNTLRTSSPSTPIQTERNEAAGSVGPLRTQ